MKRKINYYLLILPLLALLVSCSRDVFDEYYARPDYLENPIYQRLEELGNFKNFTVLIEKAGYKDILSKSGYWTMFAPNDAAFSAYFQEKGISDVSKIDEATANKIVRYALVYNAFREEKLSDYQSSKGWVEGNAFRRRTAYYDGFVTKDVNGVPTVTVGSNRNGGTGTVLYFAGDNNNKYLTYFTDEYFKSKNLTAFDFNYFYSNGEYTGFNLFDGKVKEADIIAENGVIHEVDKVSLPLLNIDQYLEEESKKTNSKYSAFREIIEKNLITYTFSQAATTNYYNFTGKTDNVYVRIYDPFLTISPNNENYLKVEDNDGQSDAFTMIVPENAAFENFKNTILLKNFSSIDQLPKYVFEDLVNAHMVQGAVWPSLKDNYLNGLKEDLRFDFNTDMIDKQVLSNGFFYGSAKVQKSNLFYSVYTSAYLDPKYSLVTRIFNDGSGYREMISNINQKFTIFLPSDEILKNLGFSYDTTRLSWNYVSPVNGATESGSTARNRLVRLLYNCTVFTPNGELNNITTTSGIIRTGDNELPGEYIKWGGSGLNGKGRIYAAGNQTGGVQTYVNIVGSETQQNGIAYYVDNLPDYSTELQGLVIARLATSNPQFNRFYQYLRYSSIYNFSTGKIEGVDLGSSYTFIVPNNDAIVRAIAAGALPADPQTIVQGERDLVADFIRYHIIANRTASNDGHVVGQFETLRKDTQGEKTFVEVISTAGTSSIPGTLSFKDNSGNNPEAKLVLAGANNLADRSLIHLVDNYLKFTE